ncbi:MAG: PAS domain S-box protein, partial [bacterium]|nr:PAS domain S-box protein [bacterium]
VQYVPMLVNEEVDKIIALVTDIGEKKKAEKALRESEEKYRHLVENTNDLVYAIDANGNIEYMGPQVTRYGFTPEETVSMNLLDFIAEEDQERIVQEFYQTITNGEQFPSQFRIVGKDSTRYWVEDHGKVIQDESGDAVGLSGILRDVTERKQTEEALRASEEKYRFLTENVDSLIAMADMEGNYIYVNEAHDRLLGYSVNEMIGKSSLEFIHPDDQESMTQAFAKNMEAGTNWFKNVINVRIKAKDGDYRWVGAYGRLLPGTDGSNAAIIVVGTDITERKQAEEAIAEKVVELQKSEMATLNIMEDLQATIGSLERAEEGMSAKNEELLAVEAELREFNQHLEEKVKERTFEIEKLLKQKEGFITQ